MATTTNYSWTTPDNTAYVKDGASAIRSLGSSVDSTLFGITNGRNVGLVPLSTTTFTSQTTVTVDSVFSATYDNYFMNLNLSTSGGTVSLTLRSGGVDQANGYYGNAVGAIFTGASLQYGTQSNNASALGLFAQSANRANFWLNSPNSSTLRTMINGTYTENGNYVALTFGGARATAAAHDGLKLTCGSNMSGTLRIYGVRNS